MPLMAIELVRKFCASRTRRFYCQTSLLKRSRLVTFSSLCAGTSSVISPSSVGAPLDASPPTCRELLPTVVGRCCSTRSDEPNESTVPIENIRNFSVIAHVDHGKSTLADRLLEITGAIKVNSGAQVLDKLQVEKDRGITVKAQSASLTYVYRGTEYLLNLIDTPGHVDFASEVRRSLSACQGVVLLIDANDGVQAQTVANFHLALENDLALIPVVNKIDLKNADPERVVRQLNSLFNIDVNDVLKISAKLGTGIDDLLKRIVEKIPPPTGSRVKPFRGLIFDSWYDRYKGAVSLVYVDDGFLTKGDCVTSVHTDKSYTVKTVSLLRPHEEPVASIFAGQIGCVTCNMRSSKDALIGDTLHLKGAPVEPLRGFRPPKPLVFAGVYPMDQSQFLRLQNAIQQLILNDSAVTIAEGSSPALGRGWRLGFLGLLHMEVFTQRLEQEYNAEPVVTAPGVTYKAKISGAKNIKKYGGEMITFNNPIDFPTAQMAVEFYEPMVIATVITPDAYLGAIIELCMEKRGVEKSSKHIDNQRVMLQFLMPLNEIVVDFHDSIKSVTSGYASFDYEDCGYRSSNIVQLNIALNGNVVEELSTIVHATKAAEVAKKLCSKLVNVIPRQQFEIAIQAVVGGKVLARENVKAYRKDVTAKLYGGDVTRRKKLLAKQAEGKRRMRMIGNIALPRETFISVIKK